MLRLKFRDWALIVISIGGEFRHNTFEHKLQTLHLSLTYTCRMSLHSRYKWSLFGGSGRGQIYTTDNNAATT